MDGNGSPGGRRPTMGHALTDGRTAFSAFSAFRMKAEMRPACISRSRFRSRSRSRILFANRSISMEMEMEMEMTTTSHHPVPADANQGCVGVGSSGAGHADACAGCPNQVRVVPVDHPILSFI